jgi:hypothetical protein
LQFPGHVVAYFFWGMMGGSTSSGLFIALIVNTVVYAAMAFVVLSVLRMAIDMTKR